MRPNIVFIISDDHRFDGIRANGNPHIQTPALDALAQNGVLFRSTYIMGAQMGAVCVPSRASLHTGVNTLNATTCQEISLQNTEDQSQWNINPELPTLAETLRKHGYHTHGIGKWHNGRESFMRSFCDGSNIFLGGMSSHTEIPLHQYDPTGQYPLEDAVQSKGFSTDLFADAAIDFIRKYDQEKPYFLYVSFTAPHDPRTPPQEFAQMYPPEDIPLPENFMKRHPFDNGDMDVRDERLAPIPREPDVIRQQIADYYAMISHVDFQIERIMRQLEQSGQMENTVIIYTADHGLAVGQHGLMGKQNLYDHSIRIPFIVQGPGLPSNQVVDALSYQIDIFPTIGQLVGIEIPDTVEGKSLIPLIHGETQKIHDSAFALYKDVQRMVFDGRWKLIRYYRSDSGSKGTDRIQLFDLKEDPWEINDLSNNTLYQNRIRHLQELLIQWQMEINDPLIWK